MDENNLSAGYYWQDKPLPELMIAELEGAVISLARHNRRLLECGSEATIKLVNDAREMLERAIREADILREDVRHSGPSHIQYGCIEALFTIKMLCTEIESLKEENASLRASLPTAPE